MRIEGSCHCRNIVFELDWEPDPAEIPARACTCSFCVKHGGVWTSNPKAALRIRVKDPALLSRYAFETRTALFHVCSRCGAVPVVTSDIDGHTYAVVNTNTFDAAARARVRPAPISFEREDAAGRLARRKRNWIADVQYWADEHS